MAARKVPQSTDVTSGVRLGQRCVGEETEQEASPAFYAILFDNLCPLSVGCLASLICGITHGY